jgi:hypothetical protein
MAGTTFTQAFIAPGTRAAGSMLASAGPILKVGDVTLFIEGTAAERAATLRSISASAALLAREVEPAPEGVSDTLEAPYFDGVDASVYRNELRDAGRAVA